MSIKFSGTFSRSGGILAAITKQIKLINFKGVKRVTVKFDPFHEKAQTARNYLFYISSQRINETNPNCVIKTDIVCNREKPSVTFQLTPLVQEAQKIKLIKVDVENLSILELLKVTNEYVTAIAPKDEPVSTIKTKSEKKSASGGKRK